MRKNSEKNNFYPGFSERLKTVRGYLTQADFAKSLGITQRAIVNYEAGDRIPANRIFLKICEKYRINKEWLLTGEGSMHIASKSSEISAISEAKNPQVVDFIMEEQKKMSDRRPFYETDLIAALRENATLLRENGDLRVEVERLKNRLEQALAVTAPDEALLASLEQENKNLRARIKAFERSGLSMPPEVDTTQNSAALHR